MIKDLLKSFKNKKKYTEGGSRDRYPGRNITTLTEHAEECIARKAKTYMGLNRAMDIKHNKEGLL